MIRKNIGKIDKGVRIVIGLFLALDAVFIPMTKGWRIGFFIVAGITLCNAFIGL